MGYVEIDIIILSYAKNDYLKGLTKQSIDTLLDSEELERIKFNIVVVESNKELKPYQFPHTKTLYPNEKFGFNKYLNIGINATSSPYICLCNNDLVFHKNWASEILLALQKYPNIQSANPYCPNFEPTKQISADNGLVLANRKNIFRGILTGWCIFINRELFSTIGLLDERFDFWYADRDYGMTLLQNKVTHALILKSRVTHLGNQSHEAIEQENYTKMTSGQKGLYDEKWVSKKNIFTKIASFFKST